MTDSTHTEPSPSRSAARKGYVYIAGAGPGDPELLTLKADRALREADVILFDDLGYGQPPCYNPKSALRTPNFDRLAKEGMRFTDAHAAAAVCTPTRYGVLTGRYPARIGQFGVLTTFSKPIIPAHRLTVASLLKAQGYATACIGKWHLGLDWVDGKPGTEKEVPLGARLTGGPNALGFDYFHGFIIGNAHTLNKRSGLADLLQCFINLWATTVHYDGVHANQFEQNDIARKTFFEALLHHGISAVLNHNGLAVILADIGQSLGQDFRL